LRELLREHPELSGKANAIAKRMLAEADYEEIASEVEDAVLGPELDELNSRAGRRKWGYVDPHRRRVGTYERICRAVPRRASQVHKT
jgi:hypothetical protein